jgi:hypothetical protein
MLFGTDSQKVGYSPLEGDVLCASGRRRGVVEQRLHLQGNKPFQSAPASDPGNVIMALGKRECHHTKVHSVMNARCERRPENRGKSSADTSTVVPKSSQPNLQQQMPQLQRKNSWDVDDMQARPWHALLALMAADQCRYWLLCPACFC